jgi:2'-5' RNA ligase
LAQAQGLIGKDKFSFVRWVDPDGIHLTLKFLGNTPKAKVEPLIEALTEAMQGFYPLNLELDQIGGFPSTRSPRIVWVGLGGETEGLAALHAGVEKAAKQVSFPEEDRPFSPHLTLGRARRNASAEERRLLSNAILNAEITAHASFFVDGIHLMQSMLGPQGAKYNSLARIGLARDLPRDGT